MEVGLYFENDKALDLRIGKSMQALEEGGAPTVRDDTLAMHNGTLKQFTHLRPTARDGTMAMCDGIALSSATRVK